MPNKGSDSNKGRDSKKGLDQTWKWIKVLQRYLSSDYLRLSIQLTVGDTPLPAFLSSTLNIIEVHIPGNVSGSLGALSQ